MPESSFNVQTKEHHKLDLRDKKILNYLMQNSRVPFSQIAKKVHLSKESVQYRYQKLLEKKVILETYAKINFKKLGYQKFHILLLLDERKKERVKQFLKKLEKDSNIVRVTAFSDKWDLEIVVIAKDLRDFDQVAHRLLDPFEDLLIKKDTEAVIEVQDNHSFPEFKQSKFEKNDSQEAKFDQQDLQILSYLCKNARISTYKIAQHLPLGADAIGLRIKKLIKQGIIERFTCTLNYSNLNYQRYVFCFTSPITNKQHENSFFYYTSINQQVLSVKKMLGKWDFKNYLIIKNHADLHKFIHTLKNKYSSMVRSYETWVIYKEHVFNPFPGILKNKLL